MFSTAKDFTKWDGITRNGLILQTPFLASGSTGKKIGRCESVAMKVDFVFSRTYQQSSLSSTEFSARFFYLRLIGRAKGKFAAKLRAQNFAGKVAA